MHEFALGKDRDRERFSESVALAWHVAAFQRQQKLPDLKDLLAKLHPRPQSVGEQRSMLEALSAEFGLALRKKPKGKKKGKRIY